MQIKLKKFSSKDIFMNIMLVCLTVIKLDIFFFSVGGTVTRNSIKLEITRPITQNLK